MPSSFLLLYSFIKTMVTQYRGDTAFYICKLIVEYSEPSTGRSSSKVSLKLRSLARGYTLHWSLYVQQSLYTLLFKVSLKLFCQRTSPTIRSCSKVAPKLRPQGYIEAIHNSQYGKDFQSLIKTSDTNL